MVRPPKSRGGRPQNFKSGGRPAATGPLKRKAGGAPAKRPAKRSHLGVYEDDAADGRTERRVMQNAEDAPAEDAPLEIDSEDDEEIDEDGAFDSEDEDRFGAFFEKDADGSGSENDDDEEEEDGFDEGSDEEVGEEGDLDMGDGEGDDGSESDSGSLAASDLLDADGISEDSEASGEEDGNPEETLESLASFVAGLGTAPASSRRKKQTVERTLPFPESSHAMPIPDSAKPSLADLVAGLEDVKGLSELRKQVAQLEKHKRKSGALPAPLPKRAQDRTERQAARELADKEVSKWTNIVKRNREAEHLSFPLNETKDNLTSASLAANFKPATSLEMEIAQALAASGMDEKSLAKAEELEANSITVEEIQARRAELAKLRSLLFFQEAKMKKAAKIKSKSYRKIKKKEREAAKLLEASHDPEAAEKAEVERARERVSLRHKNTGKWAKQARKGEREAVQEQLRRHEALVRRIEGRGSGSEDDESDGDEAAEGSEGEEGLGQAYAELDALEASLDTAPEPKKGLMALKFMQKAAAEEKERTRKAIDDIRDELDGDDDEEEKDQDGWEVQGGRRRFVKGGSGQTRDAGEGDFSFPATTNKPKVTRTEGAISVGANPWLAPTEAVQKRSKASSATTRQDKALAKLDGERKKAIRDEEESDGEMIDVEIKLGGGLGGPQAVESSSSSFAPTVPSAKAAMKSKQSEPTREEGKSMRHTEPTGDGGDSDEDEADADPGMVHESDFRSMSRRELMAAVFATDDVVADFEEEKRALEESEEEEEQELPGWGAWGGQGVKKHKFKPKATKPAPARPKEQRKDAGLKHVIINDKKPKKALKYAAEAVPFPYKTKEQYEAGMRMPLGKEWNTATTHKRNIVPAVTTKTGTIIHPLKVSSTGTLLSGGV